jgi:hypothetical protein
MRAKRPATIIRKRQKIVANKRMGLGEFRTHSQQERQTGMKNRQLIRAMGNAISNEEELSEYDQIHYALRLGIRVEKSTMTDVFESQRQRFANKYPALKTLKMPKIMAIVIPTLIVKGKYGKYSDWYETSDDVFEKIRGGDCQISPDEYPGITTEEWNKKYESTGFLHPQQIWLDRKKINALYRISDFNHESRERGYQPYWFIVLRSNQWKPLLSLPNLKHEIRHVLEFELNLKVGTLAKLTKRGMHEH